MTHRMAQWAAAALATDGLDPRMVFRLVKKVYEHRSNIVHGRSARRDQIKVGEEAFSAQDVGVYLLRSLLMNCLLTAPPWTPEALDSRVMAALGTTTRSTDTRADAAG